jgi:PAS domain S-box-containing protein
LADSGKKTKEKLMNSQEEYNSLFANMMDGFAYCKMLFDESGKAVDFVYLKINDSFEKITGLKREIVVGRKVTEAVPGIKEANAELFEIYGRVALTGQTERFEVIFKPLSLWLHISVYCPRKGYFAAVFENITDRKLAENNLKESEEKYQTTFDASMDALMLLDEKGFFDCNKATLELFSCKSKEEFAKFHPADLSPPTQSNGTPSMDDAMNHIQKAFKTGTDHFFWIHKRMDGTTFPADVLLTRMTLKGSRILHATVRDITELNKAEEAIKFQADLLNNVGQAIIMVDNDRIIRFWNKAAENLYGYSEEQAMGHKVNELLRGTSPAEADEVKKRLMAGESWSTELFAERKDGSVVPVILHRTPIYNKNMEYVGAASIATDITLQKKTEADLTFSLNSLSESLDKIQELNEKLRVVGNLTRHDVRNKLSAVNSYAYILKKKHLDQAEIVNILGRMEQAVKEAVKIFDFAKAYEQIGGEELTYINVEEKLNEAATLFSEPIPKIINECHGLIVSADSFLKQLFFNLIDNTTKYGKKTTTIKIYYEKADLNEMKLVYQDDGVGVPLENKACLFKEGFSTGNSTGFGLFLIKKMIDVYGWTIVEEGEPGKGAKFTITIPKLSKNGKENYQIILK